MLQLGQQQTYLIYKQKQKIHNNKKIKKNTPLPMTTSLTVIRWCMAGRMMHQQEGR
jgi:hypothetical protein